MAAAILKLMALCAIGIMGTDAHGYMVSPAARNSAWRYGFDMPKNYNDNELFCGGREVQHSRNGGQCGVCGDPYHVPEPRPHERGGRYGRGIITASYREGQVVPVTIYVSANHKGYYEFRLCNNNNPDARDSQRCLDKQLLKLANGSGTRYILKAGVKGQHTVHIQLPRRLSCSHCVMQWTWVAGNTWGICADGTGRNGCGPQETFVNCADVQILKKGQRPTSTKPTAGGMKPKPSKPSKPTTGGKRPYLPKPPSGGQGPKPSKPTIGHKPYVPRPPTGGQKPYVPRPPTGGRKPYVPRPPTGGQKPYVPRPPTGGQKPYVPRRPTGGRKPYPSKPTTGDKKPFPPKKAFIPWAWLPADHPSYDNLPKNKKKVTVNKSWGRPYWF